MKLFIKRLAIFLVTFSMPFVSHASIFSFANDLLARKEVNAQTIDTVEVNSQNMALLKAAVNTNPTQAGGVDIAIVDNNALLAQTGPSGSIADIEKSSSNGQISTYVVRDGDSLGKIADLFGVSVNTILWANNIKNGTPLRTGQTLVILPISGIQYTFKAGDTLKSVVAKYKADIDEVLDYNNLTENSVIAVGTTITLPDAEPAEAPSETTASSNKSSAGTANPKLTEPLHDANGPEYKGYYTRPIDGGVRTQGLHGYNAVDLAAPVGTPIHAAASGTVIVSSWGPWNHGYGNYVVISHSNGTQTLYAHASKLLVNQGDQVTQGQTIALIGVTGKTTGPHVHFEVRGAKNPF